MLIPVGSIGATPPPPDQVIPSIIQPLFNCGQGVDALMSSIRSEIGLLGFDSFSYAFCESPRIHRYFDRYVFTTIEDAVGWVDMYNRANYLPVDPRFKNIEESILPVMWDQESERGKNPITDRCLDDFAHFGVCSGVMYMFHTVMHHSVACAFNSTQTRWSDIDRAMLPARFGELMLFGKAFHKFFMLPVLSQEVQLALPAEQAADNPRLSPREKQIMSQAAIGASTAQIAYREGISESAVQKALDSAKDKLGAPNRTSAIARALSQGEIVLRGDDTL